MLVRAGFTRMQIHRLFQPLGLAHMVDLVSIDWVDCIYLYWDHVFVFCYGYCELPNQARSLSSAYATVITTSTVVSSHKPTNSQPKPLSVSGTHWQAPGKGSGDALVTVDKMDEYGVEREQIHCSRRQYKFYMTVWREEELWGIETSPCLQVLLTSLCAHKYYATIRLWGAPKISLSCRAQQSWSSREHSLLLNQPQKTQVECKIPVGSTFLKD